ncbi:hypothetical protein D3C75_1005350 [compost metagenome]
MSVFVVDQLEIININQGQMKRCALIPILQRPVVELMERYMIVQICQRIGCRQLAYDRILNQQILLRRQRRLQITDQLTPVNNHNHGDQGTHRQKYRDGNQIKRTNKILKPVIPPIQHKKSNGLQRRRKQS